MSGKLQIAPSPLRFRGSRSQVLRELLPLLPRRIRTFADLMCGGGDVFANSRAEHYILNDINPELCRLYEWLARRPWKGLAGELEDLCRHYSLADPEMRLAGRRRLMEAHRRSGSPLLLLLLSFASESGFRFGEGWAFNAPAGRLRNPLGSVALERLGIFMMRLRIRDPEIRCGDFEEGGWLSTLGEGDFAYADPPFLADGRGTGWTDGDGERLRAVLMDLSSRGVRFALSEKAVGRSGRNPAVVEWARANRLHFHALGADHGPCGPACSSAGAELLITNY